MTRSGGFFLATVFILLCLLHAYWAAGGKLGRGVSIPTVGAERLFDPSPLATLGVALALFVAGMLVLGRIGVWGESWPRWIFRLGTLAISFMFALRAIGDFRYVGFFKSVSETDFARWDNSLFSPLCLLIAVVAFLISLYET